MYILTRSHCFLLYIFRLCEYMYSMTDAPIELMNPLDYRVVVVF